MFVDDRERCRKAEKHVVFIIVDAVVIDVVAVIVTAAAAAAVVAESTTIAATLVVVAVVDVAFPPTSKISLTSLPPATHLAESTFTLSTQDPVTPTLASTLSTRRAAMPTRESTLPTHKSASFIVLSILRSWRKKRVNI